MALRLWKTGTRDSQSAQLIKLSFIPIQQLCLKRPRDASYALQPCSPCGWGGCWGWWSTLSGTTSWVLPVYMVLGFDGDHRDTSIRNSQNANVQHIVWFSKTTFQNVTWKFRRKRDFISTKRNWGESYLGILVLVWGIIEGLKSEHATIQK